MSHGITVIRLFFRRHFVVCDVPAVVTEEEMGSRASLAHVKYVLTFSQYTVKRTALSWHTIPLDRVLLLHWR